MDDIEAVRSMLRDARVAWMPSREWDKDFGEALRALDRVEARVKHLHKLYNAAQDDASREAEHRVNLSLELERLRAIVGLALAYVEMPSAERMDALVAALTQEEK